MEDLVALLMANPAVMKALLIMAVSRVVMKPLMVAVEKYVEYSPSSDDNKCLEKVKKSPWYKALVFMLDYAVSVKLPKEKK